MVVLVMVCLVIVTRLLGLRLCFHVVSSLGLDLRFEKFLFFS